jgi:DNA-binding MarR family transcriptional regulator
MSDAMKRAHEAYFRAIHVIDPLRLRFWDSRGATTTQLRVMYEIRKRCEPSTGALAEELHVRPATLTGLADRLERNGFVRRWTDAADRRVVRIGLTDEGNAVLDEVFAAAVDYLTPILKGLGPETLEDFTRVLESFVETAARVQPDALPAPAE